MQISALHCDIAVYFYPFGVEKGHLLLQGVF